MTQPSTRFGKAVLRVGLPAVVACLLLLTPRILLAHAVLVKSNPIANATLPPGAIDILLKFNSRVDGSRSTVFLAPADGSSKPLALDKQTTPDTLAGHVSGLGAGTYALDWQVLSVDGHITRGRVPFQIK
jgi:methionine-rich copper-binding protein CopC